MDAGPQKLTCERILTVWFGDDPAQPFQHSALWFGKDAEFDRRLAGEFEPHLRLAVEGAYDAWKTRPREALAFIILLDQFSRNIHRGAPEAFAQDGAALAVCLKGMEQGFDALLSPVEASFLYMPLMHSEELEMQRLALVKFEALARQEDEELRRRLEKSYQSAVKHHELIERFGRFPHRNAILARSSTPAELEFLSQPGAGF